jgi:hypothetical protein
MDIKRDWLQYLTIQPLGYSPTGDVRRAEKLRAVRRFTTLCGALIEAINTFGTHAGNLRPQMGRFNNDCQWSVMLLANATT